MALESGTWIDDLVVTNPPGGDDKRQGDDHLRLIKSVLKNSIKRVSRAFYVPSSVVKSADYTVLASDDNMLFLCDTTVQMALTLPTLTASDKGWCCYVTKTTSDANAVFIAPPSGTLHGTAYVRRSINGQVTKVVWTGTTFYATRPNGLPIGSVLDYFGSALPQGHLWADGSGFSGAAYVELAAVYGGTTAPDLRGRIAAGKDNMGGSSANRLIFQVAGGTLGAVGGLESHILLSTQIPLHTHGYSGTTGTISADHSHTYSGSSATAVESNDHTHNHSWSGTTSGASVDLNHQHNVPDNRPFQTTGVQSGANATVWLATREGSDSDFRNLNHDHTYSGSGTTTGRSASHTHSFSWSGTTSGVSSNHTHTYSGTTDGGSGGAQAHPNVQPTIVCNKIIVAE